MRAAISSGKREEEDLLCSPCSRLAWDSQPVAGRAADAVAKYRVVPTMAACGHGWMEFPRG